MKKSRHFLFIIILLFFSLPAVKIVNAQGMPPFPPGQNPRQAVVNVFLQGLYDAGQGEMRKTHDHDGTNPYPRYVDEIAEKIMVVIHSATSPYDSIVGGWINLNQNGQAGFDISSDYNDSYYIVIRSRNHLETWSAAPVSFAGTGLVEYDFTDAASKAYGNNMVQLAAGVYGIYAGDVNQDGILSGADLVVTTDDVRGVVTGYVVTDINGDGVVSGADLVLITDNIRAVVSLQRPW